MPDPAASARIAASGARHIRRAKQMMCWAEAFVKLRLPKMFNLRRDPFEHADENSNTYWTGYSPETAIPT